MSENHLKSHNVNDSDVNRWENFVNTAYIIFYYKLLPTSIYILQYITYEFLLQFWITTCVFRLFDDSWWPSFYSLHEEYIKCNFSFIVKIDNPFDLQSIGLLFYYKKVSMSKGLTQQWKERGGTKPDRKMTFIKKIHKCERKSPGTNWIWNQTGLLMGKRYLLAQRKK